MHQLVIGCTEDLVAGIGAEAGTVDDGLRMLDAVADREGLGLHENAALVQHREGVARAVAQGQHDVIAADLLARFEHHAADVVALDQHIADLLLEADLAAQRLDVRAHLLDHADQPEGADVRFGDVEDFLRRAGLHELGQHLARQVARVADLAPQLAVREGAGAALAELHIRFGIQHAAAPQPPGVLGALAHRLAAFQHDRAQAHLRQDQRGEDAAGPEADDQRSQWRDGVRGSIVEADRGWTDEAVAGVRRRSYVRVAAEPRADRRLVDQLAVDGVDQHHGRLLARVVAALEDGEVAQLRVRDAKACHDRRAQRVLGVVQRQAQFGDSQHR
eukprot:Opistho-1_new@4810